MGWGLIMNDRGAFGRHRHFIIYKWVDTLCPRRRHPRKWVVALVDKFSANDAFKYVNQFLLCPPWVPKVSNSGVVVIPGLSTKWRHHRKSRDRKWLRIAYHVFNSTTTYVSGSHDPILGLHAEYPYCICLEEVYLHYESGHHDITIQNMSFT